MNHFKNEFEEAKKKIADLEILYQNEIEKMNKKYNHLHQSYKLLHKEHERAASDNLSYLKGKWTIEVFLLKKINFQN